MSKNYIPKYLKMNTETARLTIQLIRAYDRLKERADDLLALGVGINMDPQPKGTSTGDPTASAAVQREKVVADLTAIEDGINTVPEEYRDVIWKWVKDCRPLYTIDGSEFASERTWYEYKRRFVTSVARRKGWTE